MERNLAVLIDFENIATGCDKEGLGRFDVRLVMRRLKDKGRILTARSYADWGRFHRFKSDQMHEGITMVELTSHGMQEKNRADIALAVDAMEIAYTRNYIDTFVVLSGDSDFTPLVMRLKELNKRVIGCGTRGSTSRLIAEVCDEFLYYDLLRHETRAETPAEDEGGLTRDEALDLLVETLENHQRDEEPAPVHASILKAAMKRKQPTFNEVELGFRTFAKFLEAAQARNLVVLTPDARAGGVRVDLKNNDEPRKEPLRMSEGGMTLLQALQAEGWDVGTAADRALILDLLVGVCQERVRRNRKCAVQWVLGDLLRRVKQEKVHVPARVVRGIVQGLGRAGALMHPDGEAVRSTSATFEAPDDAAPLAARLDAALLDVLRAKSLTGDSAALAEFFGAPGTPAAVPAAPQADGTDDDGAPEGAEPARSGRRRGRRGGRRASDRAAATGQDEAPADMDAASEPAHAPADAPAPATGGQDADPGEAPARRRRRPRTPRVTTDGPTED
ncbi:MAG: hypothetical protein RLZZ299_2258 [Pseudomonadota bacterium]|jgi:uncharacterized protein (TIGR00288 family)